MKMDCQQVGILFWNPDFYTHWHWWVLLSIVLVDLSLFSVGRRIEQISGVGRETFGKAFENRLLLRGILMAAMLVTSSVLSVLATLILCVVSYVISYPAERYFSYLVILHRMGLDEEYLEKCVESQVYRLQNR